MRFYELNLFAPGGTTPVRTWTSFPNGKFDPGALNIEFDLNILPYATPVGGQSITLEGISIADLLQPQQFAPRIVNGVQQPGMSIELKGGMGKGLPLANLAQQNTLLKGQIWQAFGNWEGTEMTLDFVINPGGFDSSTPGNFVLNWVANQPLGPALQNCLAVAYPNIPLTVNVSNQLVQSATEIHHCGTLEELSQYVQEVTNGQFLGQNYPGVSIAMQSGAISVFDSTWKPPAVQLNFTDLVGQPTWIDVNTLQVKLVMRGDLQVGTAVKMPTGLSGQVGQVLTTGNSLPSSLNYQTTFSGQFQITEMRHLGNFRTAAGEAWVTVINCVPYTSTSNG
ncbi:hypothetical protein [Burkholderia lata]|uniref:Uncharacterized protein n=1 Tax=Burkholderia lata (strain ATCC 17760 / DSM 23089 / LMG 22485 / NCIMB 9086 / R18194 / 383) TaxID=482957 RepID=A0A6P2GRL9_BURL3|nr:hypothetical protein [Burkholderia lata]VWB07037.1 hypothetical protein BLA6863_00146 [Burkholderia lata]